MRYRGFRIVGMEHELAHVGKSADEFLAELAARIRALPIPPAFADEPLRNLAPVRCRRRHLVWVFKAAGAADALTYDGAFYDRIGLTPRGCRLGA